MNIIDIKDEILKKSKEMDLVRASIVDRTNESTQAETEYYKKKAIVIMQLNGGVEFNLDGATIQNPRATHVPDLVKGICWQELQNKLKASGMLKSAYVQLNTLEKQLSALQSIFKQLQNG
jgi:hypothetical protein